MADLYLPRLKTLRLLAPIRLGTAHEMVSLIQNHVGTLKSLRVHNVGVIELGPDGRSWLELMRMIKGRMTLDRLNLLNAKYISAIDRDNGKTH